MDGNGGAFLEGSNGRILYVTSEGQAGIIAASLTDALELFTEFPYWNDLLKFSGGGQIDQMRRAAPFLEKEMLENEPTVEADRRLLRSELSLKSGTDPIAALHHSVAVLGADVRVCAPDGHELDTLFNRFTVDDNRTWSAA